MAKKTDQGGLQPILERQTVQDQVYAQLREALIAGAFQAKEAFTIAGLADRFKVSHMPVREALRRLAAESAVRIAPSGTAYVPDLSVAELEDITRARVIIEGAAAGLAFAHLGPADVTALEAIIARHRDSGLAGDTHAMAAANREFHFGVYRAAQSPVLLSQIENLWLRSGPYVRILSDRMEQLLQTRLRASFTTHHEAACQALTAGDAAAFRRAMEDDIQASHLLLCRLIADPVPS